jgi:UDP-2,3-diacylglucosamine pyrophosphatase LpxH
VAKVTRTVLVPDLHVPYQDVQAFRAVRSFVRDVRPCRLIVMGDLLDFAVVSSFDKDPRVVDNLQNQIDEGSQLLDDLRADAGRGCRIDLLEGNHEYRLLKFLIRNAPTLLTLRQSGQEILSVPFLLDLKRRGISWVPSHESLDLHGYLVEHGDCASSYSGYTARRMVDKRRQSVVHGHTHRLGSYWHTGYTSTVHGIELGSLIDRNSEAASYTNRPNWQTGFGVGEYVEEADFFQLTPVWINQSRFVWGGKLYTGG